MIAYLAFIKKIIISQKLSPIHKMYNSSECVNLYGLAYTQTILYYIDLIKLTLKFDVFLGYVVPVSGSDLLPLNEI